MFEFKFQMEINEHMCFEEISILRKKVRFFNISQNEQGFS